MLILLILVILIILFLMYNSTNETFEDKFEYTDQNLTFFRDPSNAHFYYTNFKDNGITVPDPSIYTKRELFMIP